MSIKYQQKLRKQISEMRSLLNEFAEEDQPTILEEINRLVSKLPKYYCDECYGLFPERCKEIGNGVSQYSTMKYNNGTIGYLCKEHTYEKAEGLRNEAFKVDMLLTPNFMDEKLAFNMICSRNQYYNSSNGEQQRKIQKYIDEFVPQDINPNAN